MDTLAAKRMIEVQLLQLDLESLWAESAYLKVRLAYREQEKERLDGSERGVWAIHHEVES